MGLQQHLEMLCTQCVGSQCFWRNLFQEAATHLIGFSTRNECTKQRGGQSKMGTNELPQACGILFSFTNRHPGIIYFCNLERAKQYLIAPAGVNSSRNKSNKTSSRHISLQNLTESVPKPLALWQATFFQQLQILEGSMFVELQSWSQKVQTLVSCRRFLVSSEFWNIPMAEPTCRSHDPSLVTARDSCSSVSKYSQIRVFRRVNRQLAMLLCFAALSQYHRKSFLYVVGGLQR